MIRASVISLDFSGESPSGWNEAGARPTSANSTWSTPKPCSAGGFVPTEWYLIQYDLDDFESKYPGHDEQTKLVPPSQSTVIRFKVDRMEGKKDPARLAEMAGVNCILAPGGGVLSKTDFGPMTMPQIKSTIRTKSRPSNQPVLPNIDEAELHEFDRPKGDDRTPYWIAGLSLAAVVAFLIRRRRRMLIVLIGLLPLAGCGQRPIPRLTAAFTQTQILYDPTHPALKLDLVLSNVGNQTLKIMKVDAGCSCRHVDPTQLPATVRPGERMKLAVSMSGKSNYNAQDYVFTFATDQGQLTATAALLSIPRHHLSPESITLSGLDEASPYEISGFDLVHREVFEPGLRESEVKFVTPDGFFKEDRGVHEGRVAGSPNLSFRDTSYHLTLKDRSLGLHRADITLKGARGHTLVGAPLVWQRLPLLSSVPERVALTDRTARVFLRCSDESVEFTHVLKTPPGVKAELDSPRSIRVTMTEGVPDTLQDFVEVGTTAAGAQTLRVPVSRYAPLAAQP